VPVLLLTILLALFIARVAGQLVVALFHPHWMPPMEAWYSGLLPYPLLLPAQLAVIALMIFMIRQVRRGAPPNRILSNSLFAFATLYALGMLVRLLMLQKGHIPIVFHWVLAAFLITYASQRR
jgi:hypothetical protein